MDQRFYFWIFGKRYLQQRARQLRRWDVHDPILRKQSRYATLFANLRARFWHVIGLFGIAYVSDDAHERIKHYLVKAKDTGSNKSLPDFIREKPHFKQLLVMPTLQIMHKDEAFKNLYSKGKFQSDKPPKGYSDLK